MMYYVDIYTRSNTDNTNLVYEGLAKALSSSGQVLETSENRYKFIVNNGKIGVRLSRRHNSIYMTVIRTRWLRYRSIKKLVKEFHLDPPVFGVFADSSGATLEELLDKGNPISSKISKE